jgi:hypothetical protein
MKFNVGDRVRFLNQSGGGIVTKIISPQLVSVAIEDGFEIPTMTSELLRIEAQGAGSRFFESDSKSSSQSPMPHARTTTSPAPTHKEPEQDRLFNLKRLKPADAENIILAFRPHDQKWFITGLLDVCLLNPSSYDMLFSFMLHTVDGYWLGADYDVVPAETGIIVSTIKRDELDEWLHGTVQMLFQKEKQPQLVMPVNAGFGLKAARFQKEDNYISNPFMDDKALLVKLSVVQMVESLQERLEGADMETVNRLKANMVKPKALIDKHKVAPFEAEVDLHISSLSDNYSNLQNHEILKIQTDYFTKCLESALEAQYTKITFIHGIGNGTLRNKLIEMLKENDELQAQSAPFKKYGYGAIEVLMKVQKNM